MQAGPPVSAIVAGPEPLSLASLRMLALTVAAPSAPIDALFVTSAAASSEEIPRITAVSFPVPPGGHFIKIDRHTGQRLPDFAEGANVQAEYIRDGQELMVGAFGNTVDAGWKMGADVPLYESVRNSPAIERVMVRGQSNAPPKRPSLGTPSSGGLY